MGENQIECTVLSRVSWACGNVRDHTLPLFFFTFFLPLPLVDRRMQRDGLDAHPQPHQTTSRWEGACILASFSPQAHRTGYRADMFVSVLLGAVHYADGREPRADKGQWELE